MISGMDTVRKDLDRRLDAVGWGLFFLWTGVVLLVPALPDGTWLAGVGALILGEGAARAKLRLPVSVFWMIVGIGSAAAGVGVIAGFALPWFSLVMVLCGVALVAGEIVRWPHRAQG